MKRLRERSFIMRDFTKSMFSFSWAMSLFGIQQTLNLMRPSKAAEAFDNVTQATEGEMSDALKAAFRAGDNLQRELVDLTLGVFTGQGFNPGRWMRMTSDVMNQSAEAVGQGMRAATTGAQQASSGWGPSTTCSQDQARNTRPDARHAAASSTSQGWGPMPSSAGDSRK